MARLKRSQRHDQSTLEKHGVDADFLEDFAVAVRQEAKKEVGGTFF